MPKVSRSNDEEMGPAVLGEIESLKKEMERMQQQIDENAVGVQVQMAQFKEQV